MNGENKWHKETHSNGDENFKLKKEKKEKEKKEKRRRRKEKEEQKVETRAEEKKNGKKS